MDGSASCCPSVFALTSALGSLLSGGGRWFFSCRGWKLTVTFTKMRFRYGYTTNIAASL